MLKKHAFQPSEFPSNLRKQLIYADAISVVIAIAKAKTTKNQTVCKKIWQNFERYRLLKYAAKTLGKTETNFQECKVNPQALTKSNTKDTSQWMTFVAF